MTTRQGRVQYGLSAVVVQIEEISNGYAHCIDTFGSHRRIPISITRSKGMNPRVGEQWVIDREINGQWTFACVLNSQPPTVTGSRGGNAALVSLLAALRDGGLIIDKTTP